MKAIVIGSGFAGLSAACHLAKSGWNVTVVEKHDIPGGRARKFEADGFTFDMGPSWYWMPQVFENFFNAFNKTAADFYQLKRLDPSYTVIWKDDQINIPANYDELKILFEKIEKGSGARLDKFLKEAAFKYNTGINKLVFKPGRSIFEFVDADIAKGILRLDVFSSMHSHIRKYFTDKRLVQLLEFPVLFLGALPRNIPALYSLMNYADIKLGTWYPMGGMYKVVDGMYNVAKELGVKFEFNSNVTSIDVVNGQATGITAFKNADEFKLDADVIVGAADYNFIETKLLKQEHRSYSHQYWEKRIMAPSCLLFFVGINKRLKRANHHTLFFDVDFDKHGNEIYTDPKWPEQPLFYVCTPSVTDPSVAPAGCENLFFLIPVAPGLKEDTESQREKYFNMIMERFEKYCGEDVRGSIIVKRYYGISDFVTDYNAFKGNAYGLANTLLQTAMLKPSLKSKKVKNLYFTGQLTVPGPGVPPSLISGEVVAGEVQKDFMNKTISR